MSFTWCDVGLPVTAVGTAPAKEGINF